MSHVLYSVHLNHLKLPSDHLNIFFKYILHRVTLCFLKYFYDMLILVGFNLKMSKSFILHVHALNCDFNMLEKNNNGGLLLILNHLYL